MSFLPANPEADVGVMLKVLGPLYSRTPDGSVKIEEFLKSGADLSSIKAMLASIGVCALPLPPPTISFSHHTLPLHSHTHTLSLSRLPCDLLRSRFRTHFTGMM
jgi:hypothetical protein